MHCTYQAVIGLGFGDEGKGKIVYQIAKENKRMGRKSIVVRYSGGSQAGHTVVTDDNKRHVFNSFGSATLLNIPTYWATPFLVNPAWIIAEIGRLKLNCDFIVTKGLVISKLDNELITPYDIALNRATENKRYWSNSKHGSCGQGIHETKLRVSKGLSLKLKDALNKSVWNSKIYCIKEYYKNCIKERDLEFNLKQFEALIENFYSDTLLIIENYITTFIPEEINDFIFESSQGILLDEIHGFFPYVTHSKVGIEGIYDVWDEIQQTRPLAIQKSQNPSLDKLAKVRLNQNIYGCTRAYLTRHGAGPLEGEDKNFAIYNLKELDKTNFYNEWQTDFKYAPLNYELLKYAISSISPPSSDNQLSKVKLVINHLDQIRPDSAYKLTEQLFNLTQHTYASFGENGLIKEINYNSIDQMFI